MIKNIFKKELISANRYEEIETIVKTFIDSTKDTGNIPVKALVMNDGNTSWNVIAKLAILEAEKYLEFITSDCMENYPEFKEFDNFYRVIDTHNDILMHNYANDIAHRKDVNEYDVESIRCLSIIISSINDLLYVDNYGWNIPDGWKKIEVNENEDKICK